MLNGYSSRAADQQSIGAAELGLQVHALLAGLRLRDPAPEALALIEAFRGSELNRRIASATRLEQEFDFLMEIEDIVLAGQIDLWFEESGKLVIVDYKTDRDESGLDAYRLQLQLYALAIEKHTGRIPDLAVLYFLRSGHSVNVELTQESSNAARNAVKSFREAQERTHFPLIIADHCKSCAFWGNLCPAPVENPEGL